MSKSATKNITSDTNNFKKTLRRNTLPLLNISTIDSALLDHIIHGRSHLEGPGEADLGKVVLVTGVDSSHFRESRDSIASVQKNLPNHRILYYDLGLRDFEVKEVSG